MKQKLTGIILGILLFACGTAMAADAGFVASKGSDKYHVPTCGIAKNIKPENLVKFDSEAAATKAGYSPCKICIKAEAKKAAFIGSKDSDKYHLPTCRIVANIGADKQVAFASKEEAEKAGYKPCQICLAAKAAGARSDKPADKKDKK